MKLRHIALPVLILAVCALGAWILVRSRPDVVTEPPAPIPPLVRVITVVPTEIALHVEAQGTVLPRTETTLAAQVAGPVVAVAPSFEVGGFFQRGDVLARLDDRDYTLALRRAESQIAQARLRLTQEQAEATLAADEWADLGLDGEPDPLVLRQPQVAQLEAALAAAEAERALANLALERTRIRAPFDGRVRSKLVDRGQYVAPGTPIAVVHGIDYAEVRLPVPDDQLAFLDVPLAYRNRAADAGSPVRLSSRFAGRMHTWEGTIVRTEGEVDPRTRMLHLVARVDDPYGHAKDVAAPVDRPPLTVGLFVNAEIQGRRVADAVILPRAALRTAPQGEASDHVLVALDDRLRFRPVTVLRRDGEQIVVTEGLTAGEQVCVSPLDVVVDGLKVRIVAEDASAAEPTPATPPGAPAPTPPHVADELS